MLTGSLDTFTSTEVLRLVAGTRKTGSLVVRGPGPLGAPIEVDVRVRDGAVVAVHGGSPIASDSVTALADMLRISRGEFSFDAEVSTAADGPTLDVEAAISEAESVVAEWESLAAVVPSLDAVVELTASIDAPVTLHPHQWPTLSAIGPGCSIRDLARLTGEGLLSVCRSIRVLAELGVVRLHITGSEASASAGADVDPDDTSSDDTAPSTMTTVIAGEIESDEWTEAVAMVGSDTLPLGPDSADLVPDDEPAMPRVSARFRHFSPRAAVAMAASEPGAHLADTGETASRSALLEFLDSARQSA